ncbi:MAG: acyl-ACP desaturase [Deltaproteobacteria bacterium]|nr:acyl-ACP desaturase [Deltaproteobacteria bacterium]
MPLISARTTSSLASAPEIVTGPWTQEARQQALNQAVQEHCVAYFGRSLKQRNWSPWHDLPLEEMRERGHQLSEDTRTLIEGFMGVEEYVGDYVQDGLEMFRENRTRRNMHLQWGAEEAKHGVAWELVLHHSLARTEAQLAAYLEKVRDSRWRPAQHHGIESPLGTTVYAMIQERTTFFHYQEVRARVRQEYGLPLAPTPEERKRGYEIGASEACRVVSRDELAHHSLFLQIVRSALHYLPSPTYDALTQVFSRFEMPAMRFIPNGRAYLRAVRRTNLYSAGIHKEKVHDPLLKSLGWDSQDAFEQAASGTHALSDALDPDDTQPTPEPIIP